MIKRFILGVILCLSAILFSFVLTSCGNGGTTVESETTHHAHEWGDWIVDKEATCVSEGRSERVCVCGERDSQILPTIDHESGEWIIDREATLKECGAKHQVCSVCDTILHEEEIPPVTVELLPGITDERQDPLRPAYELANCRKLEGKPVVVLIFMDDNESYWQEDEVLAFTEEHILVGLDYLEKNAKKWGVELDFVIESYSTPLSGYEIKYEGTVNPNLHNGGSTKDVLDHAAADIGCEGNWELYSYYKAKYPNDDIIFLNFLNKSGTSYTRNAISMGYLEYSEHCVLFANNLSGSKGSRASTIAHEILHLFGAEDYYVSMSREFLANQAYPDDIMLWQFERIQDNTIGDCTAYSVGWTDKAPAVCYDDRWWK